jgi:uncharacterized membrane protein
MNYDVLQSNKKLREYAREHLRGTWRKTALVFFVFFLIRGEGFIPRPSGA